MTDEQYQLFKDLISHTNDSSLDPYTDILKLLGTFEYSNRVQELMQLASRKNIRMPLYPRSDRGN